MVHKKHPRPRAVLPHIGEAVDIDRFNPQPTTLATKRDILVREGEARRWRYRFRDPLMEPYVLLDGLQSAAITPDDFPYLLVVKGLEPLTSAV